MILLFDMDGPIANFELAIYEGMQCDPVANENGWIIDPSDRKNFKIEEQYQNTFGDEAKLIIRKIAAEDGLFTSLKPIDGAKEALEELSHKHIVRICTAPLLWNPTCASDKLWWIDKNLGPHWSPKTIITKDKTLVHGDLLIDDRPTIPGDIDPSWEHILFSKPYNEGSPAKRSITNWNEIFDLLD